jgi:paraquat-inducible protein B
MSKKANPTLIGLFLVVGLALGVAGLVVFGPEGLFHPKVKIILYFENSLKGLNAGAPVKFRGVTVGKVDEVLIRHNQSSNDFSMPVIIVIDEKLAQSKSDNHLQFGQSRMDHLVKEGFRARLDSDSLVTGVFFVGLEMLPNAPPPVFHQLKPEYEEIPTAGSEIQQLLANLGSLDVHGLSEKLNRLLARADASLSQLNVTAINEGVTNLLVSANRVVTTSDLTNAIVSARRALDDAQTLLKRVDRRVDPLADNANATLTDARKTLVDLRRTLDNLASLIGPDSSVRSDLPQALEKIGNAGRAIADLAEFLKSHPNALLAGRKHPKEEP